MMEIDFDRSSVYKPGETTLVNAEKEGYTRYVGGRTISSNPETKSKFYNQFEGQYNNSPIELRIYQLDLFYNLLSDDEYFDDFMDLYGEILGSYDIDRYGGGHGIILVDTLTYGFELNSKKSVSNTTNKDDWLIDYIEEELASIDSTRLSPMGIAFRARLEERLAVINDVKYNPSFAVEIEERADAFDLSQL